MRDISLHLIDIVQNSISAGANNISVILEADKSKDELAIQVEDNGKGINRDLLDKVTDPFVTTRTTRKVGLGIPLLKASANRADGGLNIESVEGKGTVLRATFKISHVDRPPLGDLAETVVSLISGSPEIRFNIELKNSTESFKLDTLEIKQKLGDVPITNFEVLVWIKDYVNEGIKSIFGGVLDEVIG